MRTRFFVALAVGALWTACNCGQPSGGPCTQTSECNPDEVCGEAQVCVPKDGSDGGNDGGPKTDGGNDGGQHLPDGGPCTGIQCQQVSCPGGGTTRITGSVYDPSGTVPLYNALVYIPNGPLQPFVEGVSCDVCGASTSGQPLVVALTGPDGKFQLDNVPAGAGVSLVIQMGRWRRQVPLPTVTACTSNALTDVNLTRMPRNKAEGDIPRMAIATGDADPFECLLRKIGISDSEFTIPSGTGRVHYYRQNGVPLDAGTPPGSALYSDAGTLAKYDLVILPCEGGEHLKPAPATQNIINYTNAGGRVFATHYGYIWTAMAQNPFPQTADWRPDENQSDNPPDPFTIRVNQAFPKGAAFASWLVNVGASAANDAGVLAVKDSRHNVWSVDGGTATNWLSGTLPNGNPAVQHLTFNTPVFPATQSDGGVAAQCGRVVFSDFHVTTDAKTAVPFFPASCKTDPLTPQEKALVFMLFDLSSCVQKDTEAPTVCKGVSQGCSTVDKCCSGLVCLDGTGNTCNTATGVGCSCNIIFQ